MLNLQGAHERESLTLSAVDKHPPEHDLQCMGLRRPQPIQPSCKSLLVWPWCQRKRGCGACHCGIPAGIMNAPLPANVQAHAEGATEDNAQAASASLPPKPAKDAAAEHGSWPDRAEQVCWRLSDYS